MNTKVYVGNLSPITTAEDLRFLFSKVGMVVSVDLVKDKSTGKSKGYAFIEMVSQGDAGKAVSEFNTYRLDQHKINVSAAKPASPQQPRRVKRFVEYKSYNQSS